MSAMATVPFDTLDFSRRLREGGFSPQQAETMADALKTSAMTELATKTDLRDLEHRMTVKLGAMMAAIAGLLFAALKLIH